ncbi:hypothetical protein Lsai_0110 [Legionella sainthelensi]|uniref:Uncharacterized protein n=1 Tax=Legionella sainthelensi TaxID=28087 RepID=A0A0W0YU22_9GAMM|nr:ankyrin repeat domain-containing protein [Legionella sainthelensi]KTD60360.1 hypothetical protein Lsai_0110 [Legionella sainthelensi]VEH34754.1 Uncharacterised protein [Legionella sainthelensi]
MKTKNEELNERDTFSALIDAIRTKNLEQLSDLLRHARDIGIKDLAIMTDDEGNTILHHAIMQADFMIMRTLSTYEAGFEESLSIKNKAGKTPYDCVSDLPEEKMEFTIKAREMFNASWKQSFILEQFRQFLRYQQKKEEYKEEDVNEIIKVLREGHCNGISSLWLQCQLNGEKQKYYELMKDIVA